MNILRSLNMFMITWLLQDRPFFIQIKYFNWYVDWVQNTKISNLPCLPNLCIPHSINLFQLSRDINKHWLCNKRRKSSTSIIPRLFFVQQGHGRNNRSGQGFNFEEEALHPLLVVVQIHIIHSCLAKVKYQITQRKPKTIALWIVSLNMVKKKIVKTFSVKSATTFTILP